MNLPDLISELTARGIELIPEGEDRLRYRAPKGALTSELKAEIATHKREVLSALRDSSSAHSRAAIAEHSPTEDGDLLERFLAEDSLPAAVFHSRALDRKFIFARDAAALDALTEADEGLPVLFFGEATKLARLGLEGLRAVLDLRQEFGPSVVLCKVGEAADTEPRQ